MMKEQKGIDQSKRTQKSWDYGKLWESSRVNILFRVQVQYSCTTAKTNQQKMYGSFLLCRIWPRRFNFPDSKITCQRSPSLCGCHPSIKVHFRSLRIYHTNEIFRVCGGVQNLESDETREKSHKLVLLRLFKRDIMIISSSLD
jgi:hypothetical protein